MAAADVIPGAIYAVTAGVTVGAVTIVGGVDAITAVAADAATGAAADAITGAAADAIITAGKRTAAISAQE